MTNRIVKCSASLLAIDDLGTLQLTSACSMKDRDTEIDDDKMDRA